MTPSIENLSLFAEDEIPKKATRRKAATSEATPKSVAKVTRARRTKSDTATPAQGEELLEVKAARPTSATKAAAKKTTTAKTTTMATAKTSTTAKTTRAAAKATPVEPEAPAAQEEAAPAKTVRRRATTTKTSRAAAAPKAEETVEKSAQTAQETAAPVKATRTRKPKAAPAPQAVEAAPAPEAPTPVPATPEPAPVTATRRAPSRRPAPAPAVSTTTEVEEWRPGSSTTTTPQSPAKAPAPEAAAPAPAPQAIERAPRQGGQGGGGSRHAGGEATPQRRDRDFRDNGRDRHRNRGGGGRHRNDRHERHDRPDYREKRIAPPPRHEFSTPELPVDDGPRPDPVFAEGIVEVSGKGFGFLRDPKRNFAQHPGDVFVTPEVCRRYNLRDGMWIRGEIRRGNRGPQLFRLESIEGETPDSDRVTPLFEELTTINPNQWIPLETDPERYTTRVIDLMAPIGRGQRGLIVAPPRTGKTTLLQHIADAVVKNHPEMKLIILLVDERPEEVTEIRRTVPQAEIMASSNDQDIKSHTRIAQLAIERAKCLVEMGKHVFVLLDSITRLGRAFNNATSGGGRTMSGGVDARALEIPRKLFAAARNTEEAGSLTIIATALIETGSRMDDLIFQEFKGTGNMELVLDRKISDLRVYPAVDIFQSGTRREELLLAESSLHKINIIRRGLAGHKPAEAIERLLSFLRRFPTNAQMLREIPG